MFSYQLTLLPWIVQFFGVKCYINNVLWNSKRLISLFFLEDILHDRDFEFVGKILLKMEQDAVDSAIISRIKNKRKISLQAVEDDVLFSDKDRCKNGRKILKTLLNRIRLRKCASATISRPSNTYKVAYLGNVVTGWAKGEGCFEKPLSTLWRNYNHSSRPDVRMTLTVSNGGLKATTKDHGLTEYWAHRLTSCAAPPHFPKLFCWIYRHEGRKLRHELRCHAVLCSSSSIAQKMESELNQALAVALVEFKKDKLSRQNARLSLVNSVYENPTMPRRKIMLSTGSSTYKPPLERSKSAPKLTMIEEELQEEEDEDIDKFKTNYKKILQYDCASLFDKQRAFIKNVQRRYVRSNTTVPVTLKCDQTPKKETINVALPDIAESAQIDEENTERILNELINNSMMNDLLESCEKAWSNAMNKPDLIPLEGDENSLSSGCESTSTITGEHDTVIISHTSEEVEDNELISNKRTELDFKVGDIVSSRLRVFEPKNPTHSLKFKVFNSNLYGSNFVDEVSLVPVGETHSDFSSLKIFKKKTPCENFNDELHHELYSKSSEDDTFSAYSDESGYEEEEMAGSVANIILV